MGALYGYAGRLLEVDLSREKVSVVELEPEVLEKYVGGRGLAAYLLWREPGSRWREVDPLGPENILLFLTGPLTGYYPGVKLAVSGKSPQSNGIVGSVLSSEVALELRAAGYDGLVARGRASSPVYIYVEGERVEIRDAGRLWGLGGRETFESLMRELWGELKRKHMARAPLQGAGSKPGGGCQEEGGVLPLHGLGRERDTPRRDTRGARPRLPEAGCGQAARNRPGALAPTPPRTSRLDL